MPYTYLRPSSKRFAPPAAARGPHRALPQVEELEPRTLLSFTPAPGSPVPIGTAPLAEVVADLNRDGKPDLVVANSVSNTVSVLLGNGDGTFQAAQNYAVGQDPVSVAVGDFNGDGRLDLAVANNQSSNVSILLGNGDGTFQTARTIPIVGMNPPFVNPLSVAVGDVNRDGKADLVVSVSFPGTLSSLAGSVYVLLGNGDGTFQAQQQVAQALGRVTLADLRGDGKLDVVLASGIMQNFSTTTIGVLLGNGDGTFQAEQFYNTGGVGPSNVAVADLNGDGKLDLVVANSQTISGGPLGGGNVGVLLGNGDGTFQAAQTFAISNGAPTSVAVGDFNGDGKPDLAVALEPNGVPGEVDVLPGNGDGTFRPGQLTAVGSNPLAVAVADFNRDGKPDLATANVNSNNVTVLLNTPSFILRGRGRRGRRAAGSGGPGRGE